MVAAPLPLASCYSFDMPLLSENAAEQLRSAIVRALLLQLSAGQCLGKFTKARKFRLGVTSLHILAKYAPFKIWLKPGGEQAFVYGNHVIKVRRQPAYLF